MDAGVADLRLWLTDLARGGLAEARGHGGRWWSDQAARLVDAQTPGLADRVRRLGPALEARPDWATHLLDELGRLWTLTGAWLRREALDADSRADLRVALGWPIPSAEVLRTPALDGTWQVLGAHRDLEGDYQQQRTWYLAPDGAVDVVFESGGRGQALGVPQLAGAVVTGRGHRYPGHPPRRLLFDGTPSPSATAPAWPGGSIAAARKAASDALGVSPWRDVFPVLLTGVTFDAGRVVDADGDAWPLATGTDEVRLLALTGGHPCTAFGELEAGQLRVLTLVVEGEVIGL